MSSFNGYNERFVYPDGSPRLPANMGVKVDGEPATFDQRALPLDSLAKPYYEYQLTGYLPDGWHIETGEVAYAYGRDGGSTQLIVFDEEGEPVSMTDLLDKGIVVRK